MTAPAIAAVDDEAVVCGGALRPILAGRVACPHRAFLSPVEDCADCRLLTWRSEDRLRPSDCSTESE
jgi:hypothetical protein